MTPPVRPKRPGLALRERQAAEAAKEQKIQTFLHQDPDYTKAGNEQHRRAGAAMEKKRQTQRALQRMRDALKKKGMSEEADEEKEPVYQGKSYRQSDRIAD